MESPWSGPLKTKEMTTKCACGSTMVFKIKKPTRMEHRITKTDCPGCHSRYLLTASVDKEKPGRIIEIYADFEEMSEKLKRKLEGGDNGQEDGQTQD